MGAITVGLEYLVALPFGGPGYVSIDNVLVPIEGRGE
jgi:hypothetical protein